QRGRAERGGAVAAGTAEETPAGGLDETSARAQVQTLRQLIWAKEQELVQIRGAVHEQPRYAPLRAEVIQFADVSPRRDGFWVWANGLEGVTARTAATHRGALVGRVEQVFAERGLARVATLRDPYFRVRFRYREASGFLWGTGAADSLGRPLLEIRYLTVEVGFQEGEMVFTEGGDGYFPPHLPIGVLVLSGRERDGPGRFLVRAEHRPDKLAEAILLVDRAVSEVRAVLGERVLGGEDGR
ncbi:MAG: rod shape-determining protein MreC, partial [Thermoanaerobaculia bacterium]